MRAEERLMTENYCKAELIPILLHHLNIYFVTFLGLHSYVYFFPNDYLMLFNCYIVFMPLNESLLTLELNYLIISTVVSFCGVFMASYAHLPLLLMNQSCWLLDMTLNTASEFNQQLKLNHTIDDSERKRTSEIFKTFIRRCKKFVVWQNEVQNLLFWYFNLEFQVQALILCLSIYVLSTTFAGVVFVLFLQCAIQISILCLMGERVTTRIDQLSYEISKNFYLMSPQQRKTLQMILHWTQNMKSFEGLFKMVNLETCKTVKKIIVLFSLK